MSADKIGDITPLKGDSLVVGADEPSDALHLIYNVPPSSAYHDVVVVREDSRSPLQEGPQADITRSKQNIDMLVQDARRVVSPVGFQPTNVPVQMVNDSIISFQAAKNEAIRL